MRTKPFVGARPRFLRCIRFKGNCTPAPAKLQAKCRFPSPISSGRADEGPFGPPPPHARHKKGRLEAGAKLRIPNSLLSSFFARILRVGPKN